MSKVSDIDRENLCERWKLTIYKKIISNTMGESCYPNYRFVTF